MKFAITLLLFLFITAHSFAQVITYEDFKALIPYIEKEDFKNTYKKTSQLLKDTKNDESDLRGIIVYMNIFSSAGMVSEGHMKYAEFTKNANQYIGHRIVMPAHPCVDSTAQAFNSLQFQLVGYEYHGYTTVSNGAKTSIFCFEYFQYTNGIEPSEFIGKNVRCGGTLKSVETNPNQSRIWVCRLRIDDAFARVVPK